MYQYFAYLRDSGWIIDEAPLFDRRYVANLYAARKRSGGQVCRAMARRLKRLLDAHGYDVLWLEKELFPFLPAVFERALRISGARLLVDYDDAVFHRYDRHSAALVRLVLGRKIDAVMTSAAVVVAGNEYLAERARAAGAPLVEVVPTVVDLDRYSMRDVLQRDYLTIGWIGSPETQEYLNTIAPALAAFCAESGARVRAIGAEPRFTLPGVPLDVVPWSEAAEVDALKELDVGVMPLPDSPWEQGKCGLKLIQYMGCALPVVASPVGVNREIVSHGETGFLATSRQEWVDALRRLAAFPELRSCMGRAGRKRAEERYSLRVAAPRLARLLRLAADRTTRRND
jgi:glycosyltransferase involved in cell wall biosynthesis